MPTATLTLTEFLLARIAEDEAVAQDQDAQMAREFGTTEAQMFSPLAIEGMGNMGYPAIVIDSTRVLAECAAKRGIIEYATGRHTSSPEGWEIVRMMTAVYSDHPEYRAEWSD